MTRFRQMLSLSLSLAIALFCGSSCATSYDAMRGSDVLASGAWELTGGLNTTVPLNFLPYQAHAKDELQAAQNSLSHGGTIVVNPNVALAEILAIGELVMDPPYPMPEFGLRYGILGVGDVGLRINAEQVRLDGFVEVLRGPLTGVFGVGVMGKVYWNGLFGVANIGGLGPLVRTDVDLTALLGHQWHYFGFYFGLKGMYSHFFGSAFTSALARVASESGIVVTALPGDADALIPGIVVGMRIGPPQIRLAVEIDLARTFYSANVFGRPDDFGVFMLIPMIGIVSSSD